MQKLRVALHHEHFVKAGPSITYTGSDSHKTNLYLECRQLLRLEAIQEKAEALKYVEESGVRIDVQEVSGVICLSLKIFTIGCSIKWICHLNLPTIDAVCWNGRRP